MSDTLAILGWERIRDELALRTDTVMGRDLALASVPRPDQIWLDEEHATLRESLAWHDAGMPAAQGALPLDELLERTDKEGTLAAQELVAIRRTVEIYRVLGEVADDGQYPIIAEHMRSQPFPRSLADAIDRALDSDGQVQDTASSALSDIRRKIRQIEREIDDVFDRIVKSGEWSKYLQDGLVTVRYGRRVVPVKNEFRHSVSGIVHDQSGSGQTVFVEPLAVVERQNRLTTLRQDEMREIERILAALTAEVAKVRPLLASIHRHLGWFDHHLARARYGAALKAALPHIGGSVLDLVEARHPLLASAVPISLDLSSDRPAIIITGPNTGGKTVALKTAGLTVAMALAGLMVPAHESTRVPLYREILVDIGDEQSLEQNLSTFSSHLVRLTPMMVTANRDTLCLIDEIGAGTDPDEGAVLAEVMVRHLVDRQASLIASTHYSRLKLMALNDPRIQNALVEFDRETLSPTYHLVMGSPGSSHAFYIARRLGFPRSLVEAAERLLDKDSVTLSDAIGVVNQLQQTLREKEARLSERERDLGVRDAALARCEADLAARLERDREQALKAWRRELDEMREKFNAALEVVRREEGRDRARAVESLRAEYKGLAKVPARLVSPKVAGTPPDQVGDRVRVQGFPEVGVVVDLNGRTATVEIGSLRMKLAVDELEQAPAVPAPANPGRSNRRTHQSLGQEKSRSLGVEVDLRGMTQDEALDVVDKYLDDAVLAGAPFVRIIHGKGTGVLRRAISQALRRDPRVVRYRLGEAGEGGDGVTVAALEDEG